MPDRVNVLLLNYDPVIQAGLTAILAERGFEVLGHAADQRELHAAMQQHRPDVIVADIRLDRMDGLEALRRISSESPESTAIVITSLENGSLLLDAINAGASAYLPLKGLTPEMLAETINMARRKGTVVRTELFREVIASLRQSALVNLRVLHGGSLNLTEREVEVLALIGNAESNRVIAETLGIQQDTTKKYVQSVVNKIGARNRTHAAIMAARAGLVFNPQVLSIAHRKPPPTQEP